MTKGINRRTVFVIMSVMIMAVFVFMHLGCKGKQKAVKKDKPANVRVEAVIKKKIMPFIDSLGTLNPHEKVVVSSEIEGKLTSVMADAGTVVKKGMLLVRIDDKDLSLEVEKSQAGLRQAEVTLSNTRLEFERKKSLFEDKLITTQQFDDVLMRLALSEAELKKAETALSIARQRLSKTKIISPISGIIEDKMVSMGDYVRPGTGLFTVVQTDPIRLNFTVPEKDIARLRLGQEVIFSIDAIHGNELKGRLSIIYPSLDEKTRTLKVEARVSNPEGVLKPGLFARVMLYTGKAKDALLIPATALLYEEDRTKVFVVEDEKAKQRHVKIGQRHGDLIEVLEGIGKDDKVITVGQQALMDGLKVNVAR